jgi:hypothetical protein
LTGDNTLSSDLEKGLDDSERLQHRPIDEERAVLEAFDTRALQR